MAEEPSSPRPGRIGPRPAHLGPYLGPGLGFMAKPVVSAATAGRLGRRWTSADATPGNSIGEPATLTLADLANRSVWVGWRQEMRNGRSTKIPYDPKTGRLAATDNASTWATRDQAERWANCERADGVGVMLGELDGGELLCGIDLDTCRSPESDDIAPWAQEIIDRFMTYTEVSPSGTGAKLFFTVDSGDLAISRENMGAASRMVAANIPQRSRFTVGDAISPSLESRSDHQAVCGASIFLICTG
jgi:hypothetical protein